MSENTMEMDCIIGREVFDPRVAKQLEVALRVINQAKAKMKSGHFFELVVGPPEDFGRRQEMAAITVDCRNMEDHRLRLREKAETQLPLTMNKGPHFIKARGVWTWGIFCCVA